MTPLQLEIEIHRIAVDYWASIQYLYPSIGAMPRILTTARKSRTAGYAWKSTTNSRVEYNLTFAATAGMEAFTEIIVHELAHIVQFRMYPDAPQAHGPEFRFIMKQLGFSGSTYHYMDSREAKAASSGLKQKAGSIAGIL